ncbi:hypothetical protein BX666DRAFT_1864536, partial [Dichotomocladium elegans]
PALSAQGWRLFWSLPLSHGTRNIWFRTLHDTLPTSQRLHRISPSFMPSPACRICGCPEETSHHFWLKRPPPKYHTWKSFWVPVYFGGPDPVTIYNMLLSVDFPTNVHVATT